MKKLSKAEKNEEDSDSKILVASRVSKGQPIAEVLIVGLWSINCVIRKCSTPSGRIVYILYCMDIYCTTA